MPVLISAANLAEAVDHLVRRFGLTAEEARERVLALGVEVVSFDSA